MVGRQKEQKELDRLTQSNKAELLAIIGRRRVGKTYLIREHYQSQIVFEFTGTQNATTKNQLGKFARKIQEYRKSSIDTAIPQDWAEAFKQLKAYLSEQKKRKHKKVVFIDEFPWIAAHRSGFLDEFAYWWNDWASQQNIIVVICGSAASWMIQKVLNNKGGLHNRVTAKIELRPFNLNETRQYVQSINPALQPYSILQLYMALGGIPFYLQYLQEGESAHQAIQRLCFDHDGMLRTEFDNLYAALYEGPERHINIIRALSSKWKGLTRQEIIEATQMTDGGGLTKVLEELEKSAFIVPILPFEKKKKETLYRLIDEYSLFYLRFIENQKPTNQNVWLQSANDQKYRTWRGYAFENICIKHADAIIRALGIHGIYSNISSYRAPGVQVDMLIDRADGAINLCEMKFYNDELLLSKDDASLLRRRRTLFQENSQTKKSVFLTLITTFGLRQNQHSEGLIDQVVTLDELMNQDL